MKKAIVAGVIAILGSQMAVAANTYCGANIETVKGSQTFDKNIFLDKIQSAQAFQRYLLPNGTVIKSENLNYETLAMIADGSVVFGVNFVDNRPQIYIGKVKRDSQGQMSFTNLALSAGGFDSNGSMLIANDAELFCKDL